MNRPISWPDGKKFAFTVFDDTDGATVANVGEIYACLADLGFRITKSAWPLPGQNGSTSASTCDDPNYLHWLRGLQRDGFEIGWHNATYHSSPREETIRGLEAFARFFGGYPTAMANHKNCEENIYWGDGRVTGLNRTVYNLLTRFRRRGRFKGHVDGAFFWGDLCKKHLKYVRNFDFADINTLKMCPEMPYHDPVRPYVNYWYASCGGHNVDAYVDRIAERHQDQLEEEGGACIMYTHFAKGFYADGRMDPRFRARMERLAQKDGWFVPVTTLLEYLLKQNGHHVITNSERRRLERRWLRYKFSVGTA